MRMIEKTHAFTDCATNTLHVRSHSCKLRIALECLHECSSKSNLFRFYTKERFQCKQNTPSSPGGSPPYIERFTASIILWSHLLMNRITKCHLKCTYCHRFGHCHRNKQFESNTWTTRGSRWICSNTDCSFAIKYSGKICRIGGTKMNW